MKRIRRLVFRMKRRKPVKSEIDRIEKDNTIKNGWVFNEDEGWKLGK